MHDTAKHETLGSEEAARAFTLAANFAAASPIFMKKFGRMPLPPRDPDATINDLIFARMIVPRWSALERELVDKSTAKAAAARLCPGLRAPETLAVIEVEAVRSPAELFDLLRPHLATDAIAKPTQASGGTVFLRDLVAPMQLSELHTLATHDYSWVMREMQYAGLPKRVIVEALVPTADALPPDDLKFHCIHGEPLLCQIDHARFGVPWSRVLRLPDFDQMDAADGLVAPSGVKLPRADRLVAMTTAARALATPFEYVRVDFYDGVDGVYFGELTFTPAASLGIAPSAAGCHRETATHREYSRTLMQRIRSN